MTICSETDDWNKIANYLFYFLFHLYPNRSPQTILRKGGLNILDKDEKGSKKGSLRSYSNHQSPNRSSYISSVDAFIEGNRSVEITGSEQVGWDSIIRRSR